MGPLSAYKPFAWGQLTHLFKSQVIGKVALERQTSEQVCLRAEGKSGLPQDDILPPGGTLYQNMLRSNKLALLLKK